MECGCCFESVGYMHVHFRRFQLVVPPTFSRFSSPCLARSDAWRTSAATGGGTPAWLFRLPSPPLSAFFRHDASVNGLALVPLEQPFLRLVQILVYSVAFLTRVSTAACSGLFLPLPCRTRISERLTLDVVWLQVQSSLILNPAE